MKLVVLSSGGIDSSLMLFMFKKEGHEVLPLHINYGQLAESREWHACERMCNYFSLIPKKMDISGFGKQISSGLTDSSLDIYKDAFLPTRNLTFVTMGAAYAYSKSCDAVAIGLLANPIFPDQNKAFIHAAEESISTALGRPMRIIAPLIDLDKRDVLQLARKYKLPNFTYYCHAGTEQPCGKCISCKERIAAEEALEKT